MRMQCGFVQLLCIFIWRFFNLADIFCRTIIHITEDYSQWTILVLLFSSSERRGIRALVPALTRGATAKAQRMFDDSFAVMGPRLWNCIPAATTRISKLSTFKTSLGRFLDQLPDRPPTVGYPSIHNNSILSFAVRSQPSGR